MGIAFARIGFAPEPLGSLLSDCRRFLLPQVTLAGLAVLGLELLGTTVLSRGALSARRQVRGCRRFLHALDVIGYRRVAGHRFLVVAGSNAQAFCAGLVRPRVYVSRAAADQLSRLQLEAVIAHETHHARRRDPLRIMLITVLSDALFFLPALRRLRNRYAELAELAADEAALSAVNDASHLAAALLHFGERGTPGVVGIDAERVDHPPGERTSLGGTGLDDHRDAPPPRRSIRGHRHRRGLDRYPHESHAARGPGVHDHDVRGAARRARCARAGWPAHRIAPAVANPVALKLPASWARGPSAGGSIGYATTPRRRVAACLGECPDPQVISA